MIDNLIKILFSKKKTIKSDKSIKKPVKTFKELSLNEIYEKLKTPEGKAHFAYQIGKRINELDKKYIDETLNFLEKKKKDLMK